MLDYSQINHMSEMGQKYFSGMASKPSIIRWIRAGS